MIEVLNSKIACYYVDGFPFNCAATKEKQRSTMGWGFSIYVWGASHQWKITRGSCQHLIKNGLAASKGVDQISFLHSMQYLHRKMDSYHGFCCM